MIQIVCRNVNADDLSVNSDENQNTSEADNTSAVTDNEIMQILKMKITAVMKYK